MLYNELLKYNSGIVNYILLRNYQYEFVDLLNFLSIDIAD